MKDFKLTITNGNTTSSISPALDSDRGCYVIAAIESPTGLTANTGQFEMSDSASGPWVAVQDSYGTIESFPVTADRVTVLRPASFYFIKPHVRLKLNSAVTADRVFTVYLRKVD